MRRYMNLAFMMYFLFFLNNQNVIAQWLHTNGPYGGYINCLSLIPNGSGGNNLFAGLSNAGIYISNNNGTTWEAANSGLTDIDITSITFSPSGTGGINIFAGTNNGIFLSTDNGTSWTNVSTPLLANASVLSLLTVSNGVNGYNLFAGTYQGVFLSTDNGNSWADVSIQLTNTYVNSFTVSGIYLIAGTNNGIFKSVDNGSNWTAANNGLTNQNVLSLTVSDTNLFAGTSDGVFLSTDNGNSWAAETTGLPTNVTVLSLAVNPNGTGGTNLFAGTSGNGIFYSNDLGTTWKDISTGLTSTFVYAITVSGNNLFAGTDSSGVFYSTNNGVNWTNANIGLSKNISVLSFATYPNLVGGTNIFAGSKASGIFLTTNEGGNWTSVNRGLSKYSVNTFALSTNNLGGVNLYAGTGSFAGQTGSPIDGDIFLSSNDGINWSEINTGLQPNFAVNSLAIDTIGVTNPKILAGTSNGIFLSTNNGTTWDTTGMVEIGISSLVIIPAGTGIEYIVAGSDSGVYRSNNYGIVWTKENTGLTKHSVNILISYPNGKGGSNVLAGTGIYTGQTIQPSDGDIFLSTNNGINWKEINAGLPTNFAVLSLAAIPNGSSGYNLFAGTSKGVYLSTNSGTDWTEANTGLKDSTVWSIASSSTTLFIGTNSGVWKRPLSELTSVNELTGNVLPDKFSLEQNYPNPFNPSTNIRFSIPKSAFVNLTIYNSLGQQVAKLISKDMNAGTYMTEWNASHFASGVYFYRIVAGDFTQTKKLMLLK